MNKGRILSHDQIYSKVWGDEYSDDPYLNAADERAKVLLEPFVGFTAPFGLTGVDSLTPYMKRRIFAGSQAGDNLRAGLKNLHVPPGEAVGFRRAGRPHADRNKGYVHKQGEGFFIIKGKLVVPFIYDKISYFNENDFAMVMKDGKWGIIQVVY